MLLIIESGSTKTEWRFIKDASAEYETHISPGINPYYQRNEEIIQAQAKALTWLEGKAISYVYYYGTGITGEEKKDQIRDFLVPYVGQAQISIENDLIAAAHALCGNQKGIACILGTGSNSGYFEGGVLVEQVPPLGFWLGDEGSGGHLGKRLVLAYLHHELPTDLRDLFIKRFGALGRLDILAKAYQGEFPNRWFASFSKFLFDHRKHPFCYQLVVDSFTEFLEKYVLKYGQKTEVPIHFTGSVAFYYSDILKRVVSSFNLRVGHISEGPMAGLTLYHKANLWP